MKKQISKYKLVKYLHEQMVSWKPKMLQDGKFVTLDKMDWSRYKTIPIPLIKKYHIGICWDFVNYQTHIFRRWNIKHENYMILFNKTYNNHTFTIININNCLYWVKSSWSMYLGIHKIKNIQEVINILNINGMYDGSFEIIQYDSTSLDARLNFQSFINKIKAERRYHMKDEIKCKKDFKFEVLSEDDLIKRDNYTGACSGSRSDCCTRVCTNCGEIASADEWGRFLELNAGVIQY